MTYSGGKDSLLCFSATFGLEEFCTDKVCLSSGKNSFGSTGTLRDVIGLRGLVLGRSDPDPSGLSGRSTPSIAGLCGSSCERLGCFEVLGELSENTDVTCFAKGFRDSVGIPDTASKDAGECWRLSRLFASMFATSLTAAALRLPIRTGPLKHGRSRCCLYEVVFVARGLEDVSRRFQGGGNRTTASGSGSEEPNWACCIWKGRFVFLPVSR